MKSIYPRLSHIRVPGGGRGWRILNPVFLIFPSGKCETNIGQNGSPLAQNGLAIKTVSKSVEFHHIKSLEIVSKSAEYPLIQNGLAIKTVSKSVHIQSNILQKTANFVS